MKNHRLVAQVRFDTPLGPVTAAATERGLAGLWFDGQAHHPGPLDVPVDPAHPVLALAQRELAVYWRDARSNFTVPLDLAGTPFQARIWQALREIRPGTTTTYLAIATAAGTASASRAAGAAIGRNPVSIIVPCHRVLGGNGALTGYAGGIERKRALLEREGALQVTVMARARTRG